LKSTTLKISSNMQAAGVVQAETQGRGVCSSSYAGCSMKAAALVCFVMGLAAAAAMEVDIQYVVDLVVW
jgi:hypothetical protein